MLFRSAIIGADPLKTTREVAQELSVDDSVVMWHLKQIGKVKQFDKWPLQGRQGSRGCIPGSPGESGLVSRALALKLAASGAGRPAVCQRTCSMWTSHPPASQGPVLSETCEEAPGVARVGGLAQCPGRSLAQLTGGAYRAPTSWLRLS